MLGDKYNSKNGLKSFQENLIQRLGPDEGRALDVLGVDFFFLVEELSINLYEKHQWYNLHNLIDLLVQEYC